MTLYYPPTSDFIQKTLDAQLAAGATASATLNNTTALQNKAGVMIIDRINSSDVETPTKVEVISFAGTSGSTVTTLVRGLAGTSDQDHEVGAIVEFGPDIIWAQGLIDSFLIEHNADGTHASTIVKTTASQTLTNKTLTTPTLTSPVINTGISGSAIVDEDDMASDSATKVPTQQSVKAYVDAEVAGITTNAAKVDSDVVAADTISSGTYANISGADVSVTISVTSNIFIISTTNAYAGSITEAYYRLFDGSAIVGAEQRLTHLAGNYRRTCTIIAVDANKAAGTYTYTTQHHSDGSNTITAENCSMVAIALPV